MQSESKDTSPKNLLKPLVIRSLRRSIIRKKVAEYLYEISPSGSYISEIAYNCKTTPTNVIGAIRGMGKRYRAEESLLGLEIVKQTSNGKDVKIYSITDFGKEIIESMKK